VLTIKRTVWSIEVGFAAWLIWAVLAYPVLAQDDWQPAPPMPDNYDWIQLTSGEWLKGEIIDLYNDKFSFESDELDLLTLDWEDIKEVRSARSVQVWFRDGRIAVGKILIQGDTVRIMGYQDQEFQRTGIFTIVAGEPKEINYWSGKVTVGANIRKGNTDQVEANIQAKVQRITTQNRLVNDYIGNYKITDDVLSDNNHRLNSVWRRFINTKLFAMPVFGEYFVDPFQNVAHRMTIGSGLGYQIIDKPNMEWVASIGPAYQKTWFDNVEEGSKESESTPALVLTSTVDADLTRRVDFTHEYRVQITNETAGKFNHHMLIGFETELTRRLDFDVSFVWDRIQSPRPDSDGNLPKQDDIRLIFGIGYEF